jgi:uncharacterized membrane protein
MSDELTPARRLLTRVLLVGGAAALASQGRSLLPRTRQDQALVTAGSGAMGAAAALAAEGAVTLLAKPFGGRRGPATLVLGLLGGAAHMLEKRGAVRGNAPAAAATGAKVLGVAAVGGGVGVAGWARVPRRQRAEISSKAWTAAISAGSAVGALRSKLAEPSDLVKITIRYDRLPTVSGGKDSLLPIDHIDREGRKFLGCAVPGEVISEVMGEEAQDPIRVFAGLDSAETPEERARLAVAELDRLGGLDRSRILIFSPAGTGLVNPVVPEAEEMLSRGDVASVAVQYSQKRSLRARKDLEVAQETFRLVLEELGRALASRNGNRPEIVVYGESLGAWVIAEAVASLGGGSIVGLGIDRGAIIGVPNPVRGKLRRVLAEGGGSLPDGIAIHSSLDELMRLPEEEQEKIRYLVFTHPEDPVGNFEGTSMAWREPSWLRKGKRHPRIPGNMRWYPGITYLQLLFDLKNGTGSVGTFSAYGHDYRLELPALLRIAWGHLDVTDRQLRAIEDQTVRAAAEQADREDRARVGVRR